MPNSASLVAPFSTNSTAVATSFASNFRSRQVSDIYEAYAAKVCGFGPLDAGPYTGQELTAYVLNLPLAESHAALDGVQLEELPRLGETRALDAHMRQTFFDVVRNAARQLFEATAPVLVRRDYLERLEGWRDWQTLRVVLSQDHLEPLIAFRNTPIRLGTANGRLADYYVADVRVALSRPAPFIWHA